MKRIDHYLWPLVSRRRAYTLAMVATWLSALVAFRFALHADSPFVGTALLVPIAVADVVTLRVLSDSRDRFVRWRRRILIGRRW